MLTKDTVINRLGKNQNNIIIGHLKTTTLKARPMDLKR